MVVASPDGVAGRMEDEGGRPFRRQRLTSLIAQSGQSPFDGFGDFGRVVVCRVLCQLTGRILKELVEFRR
jgi:hypothetical protein